MKKADFFSSITDSNGNFLIITADKSTKIAKLTINFDKRLSFCKRVVVAFKYIIFRKKDLPYSFTLTQQHYKKFKRLSNILKPEIKNGKVEI